MRFSYSVEVDNDICEILISDEREALLEAKLCNRASVAVLGEGGELSVSLSPYAVLRMEDIDADFLRRVACRHLKKALTITENEEFRIREGWEEDFAFLAAFARAEYMGEDEKVFRDIDAYRSYIRNQYAFYAHGIWVLESKPEACLLGKLGIYPEEERLYLSYHIDAPYRGKGIGYRACKLLLSWVYDYFQTDRVYAKIDERNSASLCLARKLGCIIEYKCSG